MASNLVFGSSKLGTNLELIGSKLGGPAAVYAPLLRLQAPAD
jgi:hypothetical protein